MHAPRNVPVSELLRDATGYTRELLGRRKGIALCGDCWSAMPPLLRPCSRCDDVDYRSRPGRPQLCRKCLSHDKIGDVFSQDILRKQPSLAGVRGALLAADTTHRRQSFGGVTTGPLLKRLLADGDLITHESRLLVNYADARLGFPVERFVWAGR